MGGAIFRKVRRGARPFVSETEVLPYVHRSRSQMVGQHRPAEQLGRQSGELTIELHHDELVEAERFQQLRLALRGGEHLRRGMRAQHGLGVRIKRHDCCRSAHRPRLVDGASQYPLMPEVNAVENTDGDGAAPGRSLLCLLERRVHAHRHAVLGKTTSGRAATSCRR